MLCFTALGIVYEQRSDELSVVVSPQLRREIRAMAELAEMDRAKLAYGQQPSLRTKRLSKLVDNDLPEGAINNLCPLSGLPSETVLSKVASSHPKGPGRFNFAVLDDQRTPFFGSMGPNIVQIDPEVMNLYSLNDEDYVEFMTAFFKFRNSHIVEILTAYVRTIDEIPTVDGQKVDKKGKGGVPLGHNYTQALHMMRTALQTILKKLSRVINVETEFAKTGLSLSSYCQTWMRYGEAQADAEFSVMSPHFQTKLNFDSVHHFLEYVGHDITPQDIDLIRNAQITSMNNKIGIPDIKFSDYTGAFVDVDGTWQNGL